MPRTFKITVRPEPDFGEPEEIELQAEHFVGHFGDATFYRRVGQVLWPFHYLSGVLSIEEIGLPADGPPVPPLPSHE